MGLVEMIAGPIGQFGGDLYQDHLARRETRSINDKNESFGREQMAMQMLFAKMGIRWKVDDAIAAGLHPLSALGSSGASFSPVNSVFNEAPTTRAFSNLGQNISRAMSATATKEDRVTQQLQLRRLDLENQLLEKQLNTPAFPPLNSDDNYLEGQGDSSKFNQLVIDQPLKRTVSDPNNLSKEAGAIPDFQIARTANGWAIIPAADMKQRIEDSPMEYQWLFRNMFRTYKMPGGGKGIMNPITGNLRRLRTFREHKQNLKNFLFKVRK